MEIVDMDLFQTGLNEAFSDDLNQASRRLIDAANRFRAYIRVHKRKPPPSMFADIATSALGIGDVLIQWREFSVPSQYFALDSVQRLVDAAINYCAAAFYPSVVTEEERDRRLGTLYKVAGTGENAH